MKQKTIILSGPYGGLNIGDDAIGLILVEELQKLGYKIIIACDNTNKAKIIFPNNEIIHRLHLRGLKLEAIKYLNNVDGIIIGGGEQFGEPRIPNPIWGHIATNIQLLLLAKLFKKSYGAIAVGFDTNVSWFSRSLMKYTLFYADFVGVRDTNSKKYLEDKINFNKSFLGADPAFLLNKKDKKRSKLNLHEIYDIPLNSKIISIIPSIDKFHSLEYLKKLNSLVKKITNKGVYIIYAISDLQKGYDYDLYTSKIFIENKNTRWLNPNITNLDSLLEVISGVDCIVSSRMHPLIFSSIQETPFICLSRSSKMDSLMNMLGVNDFFNIENIDEEKLYWQVIDRLNNYTTNIDLIKKNIKILKNKSQKQFIELENNFDI